MTDSPATSIASASKSMALGSIVSRATGFVRTAAIGAAIGAASLGNDYGAANNLPNMVYELLLGGVLTSVIVPLLVRAQKTDSDGGSEYTYRLLSVSTLMLFVLACITTLSAPLIIRPFFSADTSAASRHVMTVLAFLLLPQIFFYGLLALLSAVLNARGHFSAPMWSPIANNIVVISTAIVFIFLPGPAKPSSETLTSAQLWTLGIGTTLGIALQSALLLPVLYRNGFRWRWSFSGWQQLVRKELPLAGWTIAYVAISQPAVFAAIKIARSAGDRGAPGVPVYLASFLLFMMMHGVVGVSVITALVPRMSAAASANNHVELVKHISQGTRLSATLLALATSGYIALAIPLSVAAFGWRNFSNEQAFQVGVATIVAAFGLIPFAISQLQIFAFYSMQDTKTPALLNIPIAGLRLALMIGVYYLVPAHYVVIGLMVANNLSYVLSVVTGAWVLRHRLGNLDGRRTWFTLSKLALAVLISAPVGALVAYTFLTVIPGTKLPALAGLCVGSLVILGVFIGIARLVKITELTLLWSQLKGRLVS